MEGSVLRVLIAFFLLSFFGIDEARSCSPDEPNTTYEISNETKHELNIEPSARDGHHDISDVDQSNNKVCILHRFKSHLTNFDIRIIWDKQRAPENDNSINFDLEYFHVDIPVRIENVNREISIRMKIKDIKSVSKRYFSRLEKIKAGENQLLDKFIRSAQLYWFAKSSSYFSDATRRRAASLWFEASYALATDYYKRYRISNSAYRATEEEFGRIDSRRRFLRKYREAESVILKYHTDVSRLANEGKCDRARALSIEIANRVEFGEDLLEIQRLNKGHIEQMQRAVAECQHQKTSRAH